MTEVEYVTKQILEKVFQNKEDKRELALHIARVSVKAVADYWENFSIIKPWTDPDD